MLNLSLDYANQRSSLMENHYQVDNAIRAGNSRLLVPPTVWVVIARSGSPLNIEPVRDNIVWLNKCIRLQIFLLLVDR
jgi:hypothetical protein